MGFEESAIVQVVGHVPPTAKLSFYTRSVLCNIRGGEPSGSHQ